MKTPEEMREYFRSMPSKKKENPYWIFSEEEFCIKNKSQKSCIRNCRYIDAISEAPFTLGRTVPLLKGVRAFFRNYYNSFHSEAQVLCVKPKDAEKLNAVGVPVLLTGEMVGPFDADVVVLPQDNSGGTSRISEGFWQNQIVNAGITPLARIHSHHILDPYQSMTDYSTLNSGTLEMVLGRIFEDGINICYWLDVPGTDIKAQTFVARQKEDGSFETIPYRFHNNEPEVVTK